MEDFIVTTQKATETEIKKAKEFILHLNAAIEEGIPESAEFLDWLKFNYQAGKDALKIINGYEILVDTCCDPTEKLLEWKPEIKAALTRGGYQKTLDAVDNTTISRSRNEGDPVNSPYDLAWELGFKEDLYQNANLEWLADYLTGSIPNTIIDLRNNGVIIQDQNSENGRALIFPFELENFWYQVKELTGYKPGRPEPEEEPEPIAEEPPGLKKVQVIHRMIAHCQDQISALTGWDDEKTALAAEIQKYQSQLELQEEKLQRIFNEGHVKNQTEDLIRNPSDLAIALNIQYERKDWLSDKINVSGFSLEVFDEGIIVLSSNRVLAFPFEATTLVATLWA